MLKPEQALAQVRGALSCGLVLHHKERNLWGCPESQCMEYAWVSLAQARRAAGARVLDEARSVVLV